jgi:exopolyphosphatase/pppGpp-phosphohydrolase
MAALGGAAVAATRGRGADEAVLAACDVGSGSTKLLVVRAAVGGAALQVREVLASRETEVLLQHDLESLGGGRFLSPAVLGKCRATLQGYRDAARALGATRLQGVGTQVFRTADNGAAFIAGVSRELEGLSLRLVSQQEEGALGLWTASALVGEAPGPDATHGIVSWDSGGASFQLAAGGGAGAPTIFQGPCGSSSVTAALVRLQGRPFDARVSPNPVSGDDLARLRRHIAEELLAPALASAPAFFSRGALRGRRVVAIGGLTCAFSIVGMAVHGKGGACVVRRDQLPAATRAVLRRSDTELEALGFSKHLQPDMVVPKLCLIEAVMQLFEIDQYEYHPSAGSCLGVLASAHAQGSSFL